MSTFMALNQRRSAAHCAVRIVALLAVIALAGCSGSGGGNSNPQTATVIVTPSAATLAVGGTQTFAARVINTTNQLVTWRVQEGAAGGAITAAGVYTAPLTAGTYHIIAASVANPSLTSVTTVTVTTANQSTISVSLAPTSVLLFSGGTQTFVARVINTTNQAVNWSVLEGAAGGTITARGVYTAPSIAGTFHVLATSAADPSQVASATVRVQTAGAGGVSVSVMPSGVTLTVGNVQGFTATVTGSSNQGVTWSIQEGAAGGTITMTGVYTAPAKAGTFHVVATSVADPTQIAIATVTVTAPTG